MHKGLILHPFCTAVKATASLGRGFQYLYFCPFILEFNLSNVFVFTQITVIYCLHWVLLTAFLAFYFWLFFNKQCLSYTVWPARIYICLLGLAVVSITKSMVWILQLGYTMCGWRTVWDLQMRKIANKIPKTSSKTQPFHSLDILLIWEAPTPAQYLEPLNPLLMWCMFKVYVILSFRNLSGSDTILI